MQQQNNLFITNGVLSYTKKNKKTVEQIIYFLYTVTYGRSFCMFHGVKRNNLLALGGLFFLSLCITKGEFNVFY